MALSAAIIHLHLHDAMTPSAPRRISPSARRRRRNAAAGRSPIVGSSATARALAAGLWRLRHPAARRQDGSPSLLHGRRARINKQRVNSGGIGSSRQLCRSHGNGILDKIEACCVEVMPIMEKATKWDSVNKKSNLVALEAELEKARAQMSELLDEKRAARKKLERFLTRLAEEKAAWKSRLKEELRMERHHRRQLEAANAKLLKEAASARQRYETERKARELMEEACEELTKEVEEDQAEVEALRRECVAMREEMEEERRMLQMAEVWREERVQMKLSDARAVLEHKYAHLNRLHAEMESFLRRTRNHHKLHFPLHKDKDKSTGTADAADALALRTIMADAATSVRGAIADYRSPHAPEDVDAVFEHFRRKNATNGGGGSPSLAHAAAASCSSSSPATELFLEKLHAGDDAASVSDGAGGWDWERERETPPKDSSAWVQGRSCDVPDANGSGVAESRSRRSGNFNTELIRRLWRSAISESRKKAAAAPSSTAGTCRVLHKGCSPLSYSDRDTTTTRPTVIEAAAAAKTATNKKKSLKEKLMEARMEDHRDHNKPCQAEAAVKQRS